MVGRETRFLLTSMKAQQGPDYEVLVMESFEAQLDWPPPSLRPPQPNGCPHTQVRSELPDMG
jgi:hypothetical protein